MHTLPFASLAKVGAGLTRSSELSTEGWGGTEAWLCGGWGGAGGAVVEAGFGATVLEAATTLERDGGRGEKRVSERTIECPAKVDKQEGVVLVPGPDI